MIDSWEDSQSKGKYRLLVLPVLVLAAVGGILYMNNSGVIDSSEKQESSIKNDNTMEVSSEEMFSVSDDKHDSSEDVGKLNEKIANSVAVTNIKCSLDDKSSSDILVSLRLYYNNKNDEKDILFKRDEIKFTVQKIMMKKKLEDINVELLRKELKNEIDNLLGSAKLVDLEFTDFKPVELL